MAPEEEKDFFEPFVQASLEGEFTDITPIHLALMEYLGHKIERAATYKTLT
jgi:hypothetical protein